MASISAAETKRRIERDDGDPDDMVLLSITRGRRACYHADEDCGQLNSAKTRRVTREFAQKAMRPPCKMCILKEMNHGGKGNSQRQSLRSLLRGESDG